MPESAPYKVYTGKNKQYVTIPRLFADQLEIKAGTKITWEMRDNMLILRKART